MRLANPEVPLGVGVFLSLELDEQVEVETESCTGLKLLLAFIAVLRTLGTGIGNVLIALPEGTLKAGRSRLDAGYIAGYHLLGYLRHVGNGIDRDGQLEVLLLVVMLVDNRGIGVDGSLLFDAAAHHVGLAAELQLGHTVVLHIVEHQCIELTGNHVVASGGEADEELGTDDSVDRCVLVVAVEVESAADIADGYGLNVAQCLGTYGQLEVSPRVLACMSRAGAMLLAEVAAAGIYGEEITGKLEFQIACVSVAMFLVVLHLQAAADIHTSHRGLHGDVVEGGLLIVGRNLVEVDGCPDGEAGLGGNHRQQRGLRLDVKSEISLCIGRNVELLDTDTESGNVETILYIRVDFGKLIIFLLLVFLLFVFFLFLLVVIFFSLLGAITAKD